MTGWEDLLTKRFCELAALIEIDAIIGHATETARGLDLSYWHYATVYDSASKEYDKGIGNFPPSFYNEYFNEDLRLYDPALRLVQYTNKPFVFSKTFTKLKDEKSLLVLNCFRASGIRDGIGVPVHGAGGHHGFVAWASSEILSINETQKSLILGYSCLLYHKIEDCRLLTSRETQMKRKLSEREKEILLWILEGKSNFEIASILNISDNTVKFHIKNVCADFGVSSRIHAAMRALQYGALN